MHPLGLCNNNDEEDLYEYGWVGVVKLEHPELDPSCLTVLGKRSIKECRVDILHVGALHWGSVAGWTLFMFLDSVHVPASNGDIVAPTSFSNATRPAAGPSEPPLVASSKRGTVPFCPSARIPAGCLSPVPDVPSCLAKAEYYKPPWLPALIGFPQPGLAWPHLASSGIAWPCLASPLPAVSWLASPSTVAPTTPPDWPLVEPKRPSHSAATCATNDDICPTSSTITTTTTSTTATHFNHACTVLGSPLTSIP
ncbi:E3 ubiquitin-protein ligase znrf3 [Merluccius polli]|uniref:RING-type E3 ubiquitin transferase n=1 Tax=Merluccius polli TaxID=89951 RepID=A0AA47P0W5_MERPO|nr:E3 ubiquitin-protein ligase znrf3 [Merluccius polli]